MIGNGHAPVLENILDLSDGGNGHTFFLYKIKQGC